jgi:DNA-binding transcriptional LysR family regulator
MASLLQVLAVAEYLNFRHAANALGVSQSSVSARIKMLEEELGVLLFERRSRGVRLTEAGRHFVDQVSIGIDQLDHAVKTAGTLARGERGVVRIGVQALISSGFFAELLSGFRELHPDVDIEIVEGSAREPSRQSIYSASIPSSASARNGCGSARRKPPWSSVIDRTRSIRK